MVLTTVVTVAVIGIAYAYVLPSIASYGEVWRVVRTLTLLWGLVIAAVTLLNIATFPLPWMAVLPTLGFVDGLRLTQASTAVSLVVPGGAPVGMAASFAMLRSWGFAGRPVGLAVTLTGVFNQLATFLFPALAVALLAVEGLAARGFELLAVVGLLTALLAAAILAGVLASSRVAYVAGEVTARAVRVVRRLRRAAPPGWGGPSAVTVRSEILGSLRQRWLALTATTFANQLTGYVVLVVALRAVGVSSLKLLFVASFAAWSAGRLLSSLPITPGGVGLVELGLTGILVGLGGRRTEVVTAVLLYRALSIVPVLLLGLVSAATWRVRRQQHPG